MIPDAIWNGNEAHVGLRGDEDKPVTLTVHAKTDADFLRRVIPSARGIRIPVSP